MRISINRKTSVYSIFIGIFLLGFIIGIIFPKQLFYRFATKNTALPVQSLVTKEQEPDNNFKQANEMQPGVEIEGSITGEEDADYYKLHLNAPAIITGQLNNLPEDSEILFYDQDKKLIAFSKRQGIVNATFTTIAPKRGDYYFVIRGKSSNLAKGAYTFLVSLAYTAD